MFLESRGPFLVPYSMSTRNSAAGLQGKLGACARRLGVEFVDSVWGSTGSGFGSWASWSSPCNSETPGSLPLYSNAPSRQMEAGHRTLGI